MRMRSPRDFIAQFLTFRLGEAERGGQTALLSWRPGGLAWVCVLPAIIRMFSPPVSK